MAAPKTRALPFVSRPPDSSPQHNLLTPATPLLVPSMPYIPYQEPPFRLPPPILPQPHSPDQVCGEACVELEGALKIN